MSTYRALVALVALVLALGLPAVSVAQPDERVSDPAAGQSVAGSPPVVAEPGGRRRWQFEVTGGFFLEAWDLNRFREKLFGGAVGFGRRVTRNWTVGIETSLLRVNQRPVGGAFLPAVSVLLRRSAFQVGDMAVFFEGGGGASYASNEVPHLGTRFNLVSQTGVGLVRPLTLRTDLVGGIRWVHVSNNSLDGRARNPDIQALGLYVGWRAH